MELYIEVSCGFINARTVSAQSPKVIITISDNDEYENDICRENLFNRNMS